MPATDEEPAQPKDRAELNLAPYTPTGWSGPLVVSTQAGNTTTASTITTADNVYIDWAFINQGNAAITTPFQTELLLDGTQVQTWPATVPLNPSDYTHITDYSLGQLAAGTHTVTVNADYLDQVAESDKTNNTATFTFTVGTVPSITSPGSTTFTVGTPASFTVTTVGLPRPTLTESGPLPGGVSFIDNGNGTATLSGTPAAGTGGIYTFTITAHNGVGADAAGTFTLAVEQPPPPPARGITARLLVMPVRRKKMRVVEVFYTDTGAMKRAFVAPFQSPRFKNIHVSASNGWVILTARKGKRTMTAAFLG
jgi:hypothetical protein